jgi:TonB family protein
MSRLLAPVLVLVVALPAVVGANRSLQIPHDTLAAARDLYVTAAYDEALAMLDRMRPPADTRTPEARTIEQYRAFCLFALGRTAEAEKAVERAVTIDPTWELEDKEAPPRLQTFFAGVRSKVVADVLRKRLDAAKALHTDKKYEAAAEAFTSVLTLLDDPAIVRVATRDLADLRTVATGFRDLAVAARDQELKAQAQEQAAAEREKEIKRAAAAAAAAPPPAAPPAPNSTSVVAGRPASGSSSSQQVVPPIALIQNVPRPTDVTIPAGTRAIIVIDVLIDEFGRVERTSIRQSVNRAYEQQLLAAIRNWRYTPATQAGKVVKYVKTLEIELTPR